MAKDIERARRRLGAAAAWLLGISLTSMAIVSTLLIWHLVRRGRLIRERLRDPRITRWPEIPPDLAKNNQSGEPSE